MAKQITELADEMKHDFKVKCVQIDVKQRVAIIQLISLWLKGKVKIPEEG